MFRKTALLIGALAMMVLASQAQAADPWRISIGGGLAVPVGDFSTDLSGSSPGFDASLGYTVGPSIDYRVNQQFGIGVDGFFASNNIKKEDRDLIRTQAPADPAFDLKYTQVGGGVHGTYWFPMQYSPMSPYIVGGIGLTNFKAKTESNNSTLAGEQSKTGFSGRAGLGAAFKASEVVSLGLEGDYNFVSLKKEDWAGISSAPSFGLKAVISFALGGATQ